MTYIAYLKKTFKENKSIYILLLLFLFFILGGSFLRHIANENRDTSVNLGHVESKIGQIRDSMSAQLKTFSLEAYTSHEELWRGIDSLKTPEFDILIFQGHELVGWTNQFLPIEGINPSYFRHPIIKLDNGWYITSYRQHGDVMAVAFSIVKWEYPYRNQFLKDGFRAGLNIDESVLITHEQNINFFPIHDNAGEFLFSLIPSGRSSGFSSVDSGGSIFFIFAIVFLWILLYRIQNAFRATAISNFLWLGAVIIFSLIYYFLIWKIGLSLFKNADLYSPMHFAMSEFLPSLAHFLFLSFLLFTMAFWFFRFVNWPFAFNIQGNYIKLKNYSALVFFMLLSGAYLIFINNCFYWLATHSSGSPIVVKVIDMDLITSTRIFIIAFLLLSFILLMEKIILISLVHFSKWKLFTAILLNTFLMSVVYGGMGVYDSDWAFLFYFTSGALLVFSNRRPHMSHSYSAFLWVAALFAIYVGTVMMDLSIRKEEEVREILVENLSFQLMRDEDHVAEMYLSEIEKQIANDVTLMRMLANPNLESEAIRNHLLKFYFYGYWGRYDMQFIPCWPEGNLYVEDTQEVIGCYNYFYKMLDRYGYAIPESNHFHYLDNQNGRVSYLGFFRFFPNDPQRETSLFIELHSKVFFEGLGYPELLVSDRDQSRARAFEDYSHAKYLNGRLVKRNGDYTYKSDLSQYPAVLHGKVFLKDKDYSHIVYQPSGNMVVVLSKRDYSVSDIFMVFSIYFIFFFITGAFIILLIQWRSSGFSFQISIQKRIQVAFVFLMLVMLVIVAAATVYYTVHQFKRKHLELLESKVQSVLLELDYKIGFDGPETSSPEEYLNYQLQMISNVFYCDINLYGVDGKLIGTSRPELFRNGLSGLQMNPKAYYSLAYSDARRFLDEEKIGTLQYISFYVPLLTHDNRLSGFVNLPYFVGNNELKEEISSIIVTVINFYLVFSFLVIGLAVFLARQITRPLLMLQSKISQIKLDKFNERIDYKGNDEIGGLVSEYNRMVDELGVSAEKLAKTERELAWREMAKQIAHEIKNPLTPMKLSIQYLQRAWNDKVEDFDSYMNKVTGTLIEQINNLSSIASEFSKFAQMPSPKNEVVNLIEKIESCRLLFANSSKVPIVLNNRLANVVTVKADGDQLLGVFNNLIKNALQAIPTNKNGQVEIAVYSHENMIRVAVSDNGKGIAPDIQQSLFVPSFTTKTGGMGLGLAIARRIVENAGGTIWFETNVDVGSTFFVDLPYSDSLE